MRNCREKGTCPKRDQAGLEIKRGFHVGSLRADGGRGLGEDEGATISSVSSVCRKGCSITAGGFRWEFLDDWEVADPDEEWRPVEGYGSKVASAVSSRGRVRTHRGHLVWGAMSPHGYRSLGDRSKFMVHRVVASAFCNRADGTTVVNHIDGNKDNNRAGNLEWVTVQENTNHAIRNSFVHRAAAPAAIPDDDPIWADLGL